MKEAVYVMKEKTMKYIDELKKQYEEQNMNLYLDEFIHYTDYTDYGDLYSEYYDYSD